MICVAIHNRVRGVVEFRVYAEEQTALPAAACSLEPDALASRSAADKLKRSMRGAYGPHVEAELARVRAAGLWKPKKVDARPKGKGRKWDRPALVQDFNDPGD